MILSHPGHGNSCTCFSFLRLFSCHPRGFFTSLFASDTAFWINSNFSPHSLNLWAQLTSQTERSAVSPVASRRQIRPLLHVFLQKSQKNYHNALHEDESGLFDSGVMQPTLSAQWSVLLNSQEETVANRHYKLDPRTRENSSRGVGEEHSRW